MGIVANPFFATGVSDGRDIPVFGYQNILETGTVTVTNAETDYPKENLYDGFHDWWQSTAGGTLYITVDAGSATGVDYCGIYFHNLADVSGSIQLQSSSDNIAWTDESDAVIPSGTEPIMISTGYDSFRYWRIKIVASDVVKIGYATIGKRLELTNGLLPGFEVGYLGGRRRMITNSNFNDITTGVSTYAEGVEFTVQSELYSLAWIREYWTPFIRHLELGKPCLFAWSANNHALDVLYCKVMDTPRTPAFDRPAFLSVNQKFKGYAE